MKLIETPVTNNLNIKTFYPKIVDFFFGGSAIKYYKLYSLDRTQILFVDTYDKQELVMINTKKKITKQEIDFAVRRILKSDREDVKGTYWRKTRLGAKRGIQFKRPNKDIVIVEQRTIASAV